MRQKKLILALVLPLLRSGLLVSCKPQNNNNTQQLLSPTAWLNDYQLVEQNIEPCIFAPQGVEFSFKTLKCG